MKKDKMPREEKGLKRVLGFGALVAYGVGDILGAGIYALVGKVAGVAGTKCWAAFALAMTVAAFTALSYAELGRRFPKSAGETLFCQEAFGRKWLSILVGWLVLCSGIVSMATVSRGFAGYLQAFVPGLPSWLIVVLFLSGLAGINFRGMKESSSANVVCTTVELLGLLLVIGAGFVYLGRTETASFLISTTEEVPWILIFQGGALAFYAFIGFEDMVNVAEEVREPEKIMPKAILCSLAIAGAIYILVAHVAIRVVPPAELAASNAPLLEVVRRAAPAIPLGLFTLVALFAVSNTALLNFVMGSRIVYGMAEQGLLPAWLGAIHPQRQTPHRAIAVIFAITLALAFSGTLVFLAGTTSVLILAVFFTVNLSLLVIKRKKETVSSGFHVPWFVPMLGACLSLGLGAFVPPQAAKAAVGIGIVGLILAVLPRNLMERS